MSDKSSLVRAEEWTIFLENLLSSTEPHAEIDLAETFSFFRMLRIQRSRKAPCRTKKGGAGKTTSSLLVAEALRQAGNHVALQDFDKQGSSTKSIRHSGSEVEIAVAKNQYTYIVFDTPPNLEHAASLVAVQQADVVIIVTGQTVVDFWEVSEAVEFAVSPAA